MDDPADAPAWRPQTYEDWMGFIRDPAGYSGDAQMSFGPPVGKSVAVAYSGFKGLNESWAQQDCAADDTKYMIDDTSAGRALIDARLYDNYPREQADGIWGAGSWHYAEKARGEVHTEVIDGQADRNFRQFELSQFVSHAEQINGIPCSELAGMDPQAQFDRICQAELDRDRMLADATGDEAMRTRAEWKEMAYELHNEPSLGVTDHQTDVNTATTAVYTDDIQIQKDEILAAGYGVTAAPEPETSELPPAETIIAPSPGIQEPAT